MAKTHSRRDFKLFLNSGADDRAALTTTHALPGAGGHRTGPAGAIVDTRWSLMPTMASVTWRTTTAPTPATPRTMTTQDAVLASRATSGCQRMAALPDRLLLTPYEFIENPFQPDCRHFRRSGQRQADLIQGQSQQGQRRF